MADDLAPVYDALRNADAAGDKEGAQKLASYIQSRQTPAAAPTTPVTQSEPTPTPMLTQVGHAAMDAGGTLARGVGATMDFARNAAAKLPGSKATPVDYGSPDSEAAQLSAPFQHAPDVPNALERGVGSALSRPWDKPVGDAIHSTIEAHPALGAAADVAGAVGLGAGLGGPKVGAALDEGANALIRPNTEQAATIASNPKIGQLRNAGYKVTGTDVRNAVNAPDSDIPGLTRSNMTDASTTDTIQRHNRALATQTMADDVGLGNNRAIQQDQIDMAKSQAGKVYDQIGKAIGPGRTPTADLDTELQGAGARAASPEGRQQVSNQVQFYRDHFANNGFDGGDAVATVKELRADAYKRMASEDPDNQVLGSTNRSIANAIENEMMRQVPVGQQSLKAAFPAARERLAKLHELDAVNDGGQVNAQKVLQLQKSGAPLSGAAADVANAADVAPESMAQAVGPEGLHVSIGHYGPVRMIAKSAGAIARKIPGMDESTDAFQTANYGGKGALPEPPAPEPPSAPALNLRQPAGTVGRSVQGEMDLPPDQRPLFDLSHPEGRAFEPAQRDLNNPHSTATPEQIGLPMDRADWDQAVLDTLRRYKGELPDKAPAGPIRPRPGTAVRANREPTVGERVRAKLGESMQ